MSLCDSFNATYCNGSGLIVVPEDKKHALNGWSGDSCLNELFETWGHFKESDIKEFIEHGSYKTKYHLSRNKSLNKDQILMLLESGSFSVLENAASNKLVDLEDIKNIVSEDDGSYSCSYKLLGVLSNPNVDEKTIDGLKDNKYGWVRKKVFSIINNYKDDDLKDRYKVLGLIENPNIDSKLKEKLKTSLSGLESNKYKLRFSAEGADTLEYVYGEFDLNEMAEHINKSLSNGQESWGEYCANNWYDFGESEYGLNKSSIDIKIEVEDKQEGFTLNFGSEGSESTYGHDGLSEGKFAHVAASYESGEYGFADFDLEFEFRPENINLETTDYKLLISGIEYSGPSGEDNNYSEGELINTSTHGTDIELYFKAQGSLIDVTSYDDILGHVDNDKEKITEETIKKYFEFVLSESKNNVAGEKKSKKQNINKIISNIDMDVLGEIMGDKAESIEYSDHNIVVFNIEAEDLEGGAFEKMEEIGSVEYGDWNMLGEIVSEEEVNKIKKDFAEDLKNAKENDETEIDDYSQIYMSFLYCEGVYVWSASTAPIG